jgi:diguanylate cyclase (GGDEF)-like protein/putative nucleotidyltransferase with HDIG domain
MKIFGRQHPLDRRTEDVSEHILVSQIINLLLVALAFLSVYTKFQLGQQNILSPDYVFVNVIILIFFISIIPYVLQKLLAESNFFPRFISAELIIITILFPVVTVLIYGTSGHSGAKILFFIPVIMAATSYGKKFGLASAFGAAFILFLFDAYHLEGRDVSNILQLDLIFSGVMVTLAWLMGGFTDIEKRTREGLLLMANTDALTGLANYHHFQERLAEEFARAKKNQNPLALIMMDLDYFKFYQDTYGHQKGNEVLAKVGEILAELVTEPFFPARYGGEVFIITLPGLTKEFAQEKILKIEEAIENFPFTGMEIQPLGKMTVSMGVACFPEDGATPEELLQAADDDFYRTKYGGRRDHLNVAMMDQLGKLSFFERGLLGSLKNILTAVNIKDRYTFGHSERVMAYAVAVAEKIQLDQEKMIELRYGAYLHDIGKIDVHSNVLNKEGSLTTEEWEMIKRHPLRGCELVRPLISFADVVSSIRYHHENYDGSGYPDGLRGEEIPLAARILRIADSFDAMTTERPYKKAKAPLEACRELREKAGKLYDPFLLENFIEMIIEREKQAGSNQKSGLGRASPCS